MNLLIVDGQPEVTEGLRGGIHWEAIGITAVRTACTAAQSRVILESQPIDILLGNMSMLDQNGLELMQWMRERKIAATCIFMFEERDLDLAKECLWSGAFDYVVLPTSYELIRNVVRRAVQEIEKSRSREELYEMGRAFSKQARAIVAQAIRGYLDRQHNERDIRALQEIGRIPSGDRTAWLILIHVLRWDPGAEPWERQVLGVAFNNIAAKTFESYSAISPIASINDYTFAMMLQTTEGEDMSRDEVNLRLVFLRTEAERQIRCQLAFYLDEPLLLKDMPDLWDQLLKMRDDNVSLKAGIFRLNHVERERHTFHLPQIRSWHMLLRDGHPESMEEEAYRLLDEMAASGELTRESLRAFYGDFMRVVYYTLHESLEEVSDLFSEEDAMELYCNGIRSIDDMKMLIHYVAGKWEKSEETHSSDEAVETVRCYIRQHPEEDLRREDLARMVHLNPDYLSRLMKKKTGYSLKEYTTRSRMEYARTLLRTTDLPVGTIAVKVGYSNFSHFSSSYRKIMGITPQEEQTSFAKKRHK